MVVTRAVDERMWILNRAGKIPFVISGQGHEGAQVGIAYPLRKGHDWMVPYYRSVASLITFGMSPREIMLAQFARGVDPSSRAAARCPATTASRRATSCPSRRRWPRSCSTRPASPGPPSCARPSRSSITYIGEGSSNQGDFHEGLNFAGIHQLPVDLRGREQRLRDLACRCRCSRRWRTSPSAAPATTCPA